MKNIICIPPRCGSTIAFKICDSISKTINVTPVLIMNNDFKKLPSKFIAKYRGTPTEEAMKSISKNMNCIIQLRDPRDILISQYFSWKYLHANDIKSNKAEKWKTEYAQTDIDSFVIKASEWWIDDKYKNLKEISNTINNNNLLFITYEEMFLDFKNWLRKISKFVAMNENQINAIYAQYNKEFDTVRELTESEMIKGINRHKRKGTPGDYKEKLKPETIKIVNSNLKEIMSLFKELNENYY